MGEDGQMEKWIYGYYNIGEWMNKYGRMNVCING